MPKTPSFSAQLNKWYRANARDLPWRHTYDPYKIWMSEVMLQQTTVNAVIPYYKRWIKTFPTVHDVAKASPQKILKQWQGLGYYNRARNLHKAAKIISTEYKGKVPDSADELKKLPGFGPYTVGAVLSIAFDIRYPIVDANVRRVIMRILAKEGYADTTQDEDVLKYLETVLPQKNLRTFNQALMELGAMVCRSKEPICTMCPVKSFCRAYEKGTQEIIPTRKKKEIKDLNVSIGILKKNKKYFIQKRSSKGLLADLWEFPGGKIEGRENPKDALVRELKEEIKVEISKARHLFDVVHYYTQYRVKLHVFECFTENEPSTKLTKKWVSYPDFSKYPMPSGSAKIVDKLAKL